MSDQDKGRIAIKFAAAPPAHKPAARAGAAPSSLGKRPRPRAFSDNNGGHDSDSDHDEHQRPGHGSHEAITGFGAHGAEPAPGTVAAPRAPPVIARQPNRDWRAEARAQRRGKDLLPAEARARQDGSAAAAVDREPADGDKDGVKWGLTVVKGQPKAVDDEHQPAAAASSSSSPAPRQPSPPASRSADDAAMDALLGRAPPSHKAIAMPPAPPLSEDDAYRRSAAAAAAPSTLADYDAMPVEDFGAALLRGMGWDGEPRGPKVKQVRRRANRLGLGAKELKGAEDLGAWNQAGARPNKRRPRLDEYRREEARRRDGDARRREDSYKRERDRDREAYRDGVGRGASSDRDRHAHRSRDYDRDHDRDRRR